MGSSGRSSRPGSDTRSTLGIFQSLHLCCNLTCSLHHPCLVVLYHLRFTQRKTFPPSTRITPLPASFLFPSPLHSQFLPPRADFNLSHAVSHTGTNPCSPVSNAVGVILLSTFQRNCNLPPAPLPPTAMHSRTLTPKGSGRWAHHSGGHVACPPSPARLLQFTATPRMGSAHAKFTVSFSRVKLRLPVNYAGSINK